MSSARSRDRWRRGVGVVGALVTAASLTATGWLSGQASKAHAADQQRKAEAKQQAWQKYQRERAAWEAQQAAALAARTPRVKVVWKKRPYVTRVHTVVVDPQVGGGTVSASGGTTSSSSSGSSWSGGSGGSSSGGGGGSTGAAPPRPSSPAPAHSAPAPAPPPPPAPSTGS